MTGFEVPANIRMEGGWSFTGWVYWQYTVGNFHEEYLLPLIAALEAEGRQAQADFLRGEWEKKVKYSAYDHPWPFASEMPIDSTAYESTCAAARYAMERGLQPDTNLWHDRNLNKWFSHPVIAPQRHEEFLRRQHLANLACRGVLEANYWSLGSDFRGCGGSSYTLSYMSQMGGWATQPAMTDVFFAGQDSVHTYRIPAMVLSPSGAVPEDQTYQLFVGVPLGTGPRASSPPSKAARAASGSTATTTT